MSVHHTYSREPLEQGTWQKQTAGTQDIAFIHTREPTRFISEINYFANSFPLQVTITV